MNRKSFAEKLKSNIEVGQKLCTKCMKVERIKCINNLRDVRKHGGNAMFQPCFK